MQYLKNIGKYKYHILFSQYSLDLTPNRIWIELISSYDRRLAREKIIIITSRMKIWKGFFPFKKNLPHWLQEIIEYGHKASKKCFKNEINLNISDDFFKIHRAALIIEMIDYIF